MRLKNFISYNVSELVDDGDALGYTASTVIWCKLPVLDAQSNILYVTTQENITYAFDLKTGDIISITESTAAETGSITSPERPVRLTIGEEIYGDSRLLIVLVVACATVFIAVAAIVVFLLLSRKKQNRS